MTKKTILLHIGRHKTGTTSLQHYFWQNADRLAKRGVLYPKAGRKYLNGDEALAHHDFSQVLQNGSPKDIETLMAELKVEAQDFQTILMSSENFQNQIDFDGLAEAFAPYDLTVICYMRESLGYGLSAFAQRIRSSADVYSLRQYMKRQSSLMGLFVRNWSGLADRIIFRLYERESLEKNNIIDDFLETIDLQDFEDTRLEQDANQSLSGNLLGLKLILNLLGQSQLVPHSAFDTAARLDERFSGKVFVSDALASELRSLGDYNAVLKSLFPDMPEPSFEGGSKLFDLTRWDQDMELLSTLPEFGFVKSIRLGVLGQILENHGVLTDFGEADILTPDQINSIRLPDESHIRQIRQRAADTAKDAAFARKERANAEHKAEMAREELRQSVAGYKEIVANLKQRARLAETERDQLLSNYNKRVAQLTYERDTLNQQLKSISDISKTDVGNYQAQLKIVAAERDEARLKINENAKMHQSEMKNLVELLNNKIDKITAERDTLSVSLKATREKAVASANVYQAQIEAIVAERDEARLKINENAKMHQSEMKNLVELLNKKIDKITAERDTLSVSLKATTEKAVASSEAYRVQLSTVGAERDEARAELYRQSENFNAVIDRSWSLKARRSLSGLKHSMTQKSDDQNDG